MQRTMRVAFRTHSCSLWPLQDSFLSSWAASSTVTVKKANLSLNTVKHSKVACWAIIRLSKPCIRHHYANDQVVQTLPTLFCTVCNKKAVEEPGNEARLSHSPSHFISILLWFLCWTQLPSFCFTVQVMMVLKMPFQSGNSLALHQRMQSWSWINELSTERITLVAYKYILCLYYVCIIPRDVLHF